LPSYHTYDVAVIGSGPAGASAALPLATAGARVALIEKAGLPRYKTCGGGVVRRAIRLLPVDVEGAIQRQCHTAELNVLDAGLHFLTRRTEPIVSMTMRSEFDFSVVAAAKAAGAEIRENSEVVDVVADGESVKLETTKGTIRARFVVAADGATGMLARKAGPRDGRQLIPALECEVSVSDHDLERFSQTARFDFGVVPFGYAWVFPKRSHLSIGVLTMRRAPVNLNDMFARYLHLIGIEQTQNIERHGFLIPVRPRRGPLVDRRIILTGDAAGLADPVTGEGITFAIQSAQMAAQALVGADFKESRVAEAYQTELAKSILPELRIGRLLARALYDSPNLQRWLFQHYGQRFSEAVTDVIMGDKTYRGILSNPLSYLKLLRFKSMRKSVVRADS